jgi:uncharacterized membrane protein
MEPAHRGLSLGARSGDEEVGSVLAIDVQSSDVVLVAAVFLACAVEMVEALTVVIAVGTTATWRAALWGAGAAVVALAALVALFGPALVRIPIDVLRIVVGSVLLVFGLQWLRKAVLRSSGLMAKRDEDAKFAEAVGEVAEASASGEGDRAGFVLAFKGVLLEGLEVVIAVLTLGASAHRLGLAAVTAAVAIVLVALVGAIVARQLTGVPENAMKLAVGIMLISFGTFWLGEGLRVRWPGGDVAVLALVGIYGAFTWVCVRRLRAADEARGEVVA